MRIAVKLTLSILVILVLLELAIVWSVFHFGTENLKEKLTDRVTYRAGLIERLVDEYGRKALEFASLFAEQKGVKEAYSLPEEEGRAELAAAVGPMIRNIEKNLGVKEFNLSFHKPPAVSFFRSWTDKYGEDLSGFRKTILHVYKTKKSLYAVEIGKSGMVIRGIAPIFGAEGKYLGSVEMFYDPLELLHLIEANSRTRGIILLVDGKKAKDIFFKDELAEDFGGEIGGYLVSKVSDQWIKPKTMISPALLGQAAASGKPVSRVGKVYTEAYIPIKDFTGATAGQIVLVSNIRQERLKIEEAIVRTALLLAGAGLILFIILFFLLGRIVIRPIKLQTSILHSISEGDGDLSRELRVGSNDEMGEMARYFNKFTKKLRGIVLGIKASSSENISIKEELSGNAQATSASVETILTNISGVSGQFENLDKDIVQSSAAVQEMSASITSLEKQVENQVAMVEQATAAITEMLASIESVAKITEQKLTATRTLLETARNGGEKLSNTTSVFQSGVASRMDAIKEMTTIISGIASQTDLLSMNAAIEAAHAGEAGKGFAVVADEIRKLAESTTENSKNIDVIIQEMIDSIQITGETAQDTSLAFEEIDREVKSVANALEEINASTAELLDSSKQIQEAMISLKDISSVIRSSYREMDVGAQEMSTVMIEVRQISARVRENVDDVRGEADNIAKTVAAIRDSVFRLDSNAEELDREISLLTVRSAPEDGENPKGSAQARR